MSTEFVVVREGNRLAPASSLDLEILERVRPRVPYSVKLWQPRSLRHNAWYRALIAAVAEAIGTTAERLHQDLKLRAGLFDMHVIGKKRKTAVAVLRSTEFASLDEVEFKAFTNFALHEILTDIMPGAERQELVRKVDEIAGISLKDLA